jgi:hypothetical protein
MEEGRESKIVTAVDKTHPRIGNGRREQLQTLSVLRHGERNSGPVKGWRKS